MRIAWIHYLRIFAAFGVVLIHSSAGSVFRYAETPRVVWEIANLCNACARWTVPVFVMISGYLLLEPSWEGPIDFYRRRLTKLLIPSIIAIVFFSFVSLAQFVVIRGAASLRPLQFDFTAIASIGKEILLNAATGFPFYHLWYLYMILGLFLMTPLFRKLIERIDVRSLGIVCASLFVVTVAVVTHLSLVTQTNCMYIIGNAPFPTWFLPYLGYFFCGYFFRVKTFRPNKWILICIFIASVATTAGLNSYFSARGQTQIGLFFYSFTGVTVVPMAISIFLFFQQMSFKENYTIETLGNLTFGIYLIHPLFQTMASVLGFGPILRSSPLGIPICALVVFFTSAAVIYVLIQLTQKDALEMPMEERVTMPPDERTTMF